jgi:hypothetical protein
MEFKITMFSKVLKCIKQKDIYEFLKSFVIPYVLETYDTVHGIEATMNNGLITFSFQNQLLPFAMVECK